MTIPQIPASKKSELFFCVVDQNTVYDGIRLNNDVTLVAATVTPVR